MDPQPYQLKDGVQAVVAPGIHIKRYKNGKSPVVELDPRRAALHEDALMPVEPDDDADDEDADEGGGG